MKARDLIALLATVDPETTVAIESSSGEYAPTRINGTARGRLVNDFGLADIEETDDGTGPVLILTSDPDDWPRPAGRRAVFSKAKP